MPLLFRILTVILPARWFMQISRNSFLKEATFLDLWIPFLALSLIAYFMIRLASKKFQRDLGP